MASSTNFANVNDNGNANYNDAANTWLFVRPITYAVNGYGQTAEDKEMQSTRRRGTIRPLRK